MDTDVVFMQAKRLMKGDPDHQQIVETARRIYGWFPVKDSFDQGVARYTAVAAAIYKLATLTEYRDKQTGAGHLIGCLSWLYALNLPNSNENGWALKDRLDRSIATASNADLHERVQLEAKITASNLGRLWDAYVKRQSAVCAIRTDIKKGGYPTPKEYASEQAEAEARAVAAKITDLAMYDVKSCVFQDGIMHAPEQCWVFYDGRELVSELPDRFHRGLRIPRAITFLATRSDVTSLEAVVKQEESGTGLYSSGFNFQFHMSTAIHHDGTLTVDADYGLYPLEHAFKEAGAEELYEVFWLTHLMRLADLVIPETVKRKRNIRNWPVQPRRRAERAGHRQDVENLFAEFWVPRLHVIYEEDLEAAIAKEADESQAFTRSISREEGEVRQQRGYFVPLREGCNITSRAQKLSLEERGELPPSGYTYVRNHPHWYPGKTPAGYVAKRRHSTVEE